MIEKVTMPQLGESVTEGTITTWLKQPGDDIQLYDPICEITTDKVNAEVPATVAGTLHEIVAAEGSTVAVGDVICSIKKSGEETGSDNSRQNDTHTTDTSISEGTTAVTTGEMKKRYSPAVLKLAQESNIDLQQIEGSGRGGRITRKDVLAYIAQGTTGVHRTEQSDVSSRETIGKQKAASVAAHDGDREIELTPVRRTIAERMVKSKQEAPHAWMMVEADVTELVQLRQKVKDDYLQQEGIRLTYMPFFIKAVVESLKLYPRLNAAWVGDKIVEKSDVNISVAIAGEDSLYVPVIHQADRLSLLGIAKALDALIRKTAKGELTLNDTQGGTFTVNNTGTFGSIASAPIINIPQAAIISMESVVKRPVIINDAIAVRSMVNFCLSLDHRVLDGSMAGKFMQSVRQKMEAYGENTSLY